jgi:hypothetical protein
MNNISIYLIQRTILVLSSSIKLIKIVYTLLFMVSFEFKKSKFSKLLIALHVVLFLKMLGYFQQSIYSQFYDQFYS